MSLSILGCDDAAVSDESRLDGFLPLDVICGRGRPYQKHPGNMRFLTIVDRYKERYSKARRQDKLAIAEEALRDVKRCRFQLIRFLRRAEDDSGWVEVKHDAELDKVSHALRAKSRCPTRTQEQLRSYYETVLAESGSLDFTSTSSHIQRSRNGRARDDNAQIQNTVTVPSGFSSGSAITNEGAALDIPSDIVRIQQAQIATGIRAIQDEMELTQAQIQLRLRQCDPVAPPLALQGGASPLSLTNYNGGLSQMALRPEIGYQVGAQAPGNLHCPSMLPVMMQRRQNQHQHQNQFQLQPSLLSSAPSHLMRMDSAQTLPPATPSSLLLRGDNLLFTGTHQTMSSIDQLRMARSNILGIHGFGL